MSADHDADPRTIDLAIGTTPPDRTLDAPGQTPWHPWIDTVALALVVLVTTMVLFFHLGSTSLGGDEAIYATIALHGLQSGDVWPLRLPHGQPYFNKPPLRTLINVATLQVLEPSEWTIRVPDAVFAITTVVLVFFFSRRTFGRGAALLAVALLLGARGWVFEHCGREGVTDSLTVLLATIVILVWARFQREPSRDTRSIWIAALAVAVADQTRPLFGLGLAVMAVLLNQVLPPVGWNRSRALRFGSRMVVASALSTGLWVVHCLTVDARWFWKVRHSDLVVRVTRGIDARHLNPPWFYLDRLAEDFGWWLLLAPLTLIAISRAQGRHRTARVGWWLTLWVSAVIALYSLSASRLSWYIYPVYPALAVLLGSAAATLTSRRCVPVTAALALGLAVVGTHRVGASVARSMEPPRRAAIHRLVDLLKGNPPARSVLDTRLLGWKQGATLGDQWYLLQIPDPHWTDPKPISPERGTVVLTTRPLAFLSGPREAWFPLLCPDPGTGNQIWAFSANPVDGWQASGDCALADGDIWSDGFEDGGPLRWSTVRRQ